MNKIVEALIESARLLGGTQAKKGFGCYTEQDSRFERAMHESIAKHSRALAEHDAQPAAEPAQADEIAEILWHHFGADHVERWEDEAHKAEFRAAALAVTTAQPAAEPQQERTDRERFDALVDDLLVASENDETESARQKAHEWFEARQAALAQRQP
jgi:hypothetical protein